MSPAAEPRLFCAPIRESSTILSNRKKGCVIALCSTVLMQWFSKMQASFILQLYRGLVHFWTAEALGFLSQSIVFYSKIIIGSFPVDLLRLWKKEEPFMLKNFSLRKKLFALVAASLALFFAASFISLVCTSQIQAVNQQLGNLWLPSLTDAQEIKGHVADQRA